jgi:hypothetical protein
VTGNTTSCSNSGNSMSNGSNAPMMQSNAVYAGPLSTLLGSCPCPWSSRPVNASSVLRIGATLETTCSASTLGFFHPAATSAAPGSNAAPAVALAAHFDGSNAAAAHRSSSPAAAAAPALHAPAPAALMGQCPVSHSNSSSTSRSNSSSSADAAGATCSLAAQSGSLFWQMVQQYAQRLPQQQQQALKQQQAKQQWDPEEMTIGQGIEIFLDRVFEGREHCRSPSTVALAAASGVLGSIVWVSVRSQGCFLEHRLYS